VIIKQQVQLKVLIVLLLALKKKTKGSYVNKRKPRTFK